MKIKDFFILAIKLFGLYSALIAIFKVLPQNFSLIIFSDESAEVYIFAASIIVFLILFFLALLFYADKIVEMFRLDKNFSSDIFDLGNFKEDSYSKDCIHNNRNIYSSCLFTFSGWSNYDQPLGPKV